MQDANYLEKFKALCDKYNIQYERYRDHSGFSEESCLIALQAEGFDEEYWFSSRQERHSLNRSKFNQFLVSHGVDPSTYRMYRRNKIDAWQLLESGVELDPEYWLTPGSLPTLDEAREVLVQELEDKGLSELTYESTYKRSVERIQKEITWGYLNRYEDYFSSCVFAENLGENAESKSLNIVPSRRFEFRLRTSIW